MSNTTPQVVRTYLKQLGDALDGVPEAVRAEILGGVREELTGLDAPTAAERIESLGDPLFIAAEARAAASEEELGAPGLERGTRAGAGEHSWLPVVVALVVAFGGIVVPVVGWIAGITMMWFSRAWWVWEKTIVTIIPAAGLIGANVIALLFALAAGEPIGSSVEFFGVPVLFGGVTWWNLAIGVYGLTAASGFWLLYRSRRSPRPAP